MASIKRIKKELEKCINELSSIMHIEVDENDIHLWNVNFFGPQDSPYEGETFKFKVCVLN